MLSVQDITPSITSVIFIVAFVCLVVYATLLQIRRPGGLPPGPKGYPIFGVMPLLGKTPHLKVQEWWRNYGDIFAMYMGQRLCVVINGSETYKECFVRQSEVFSGRPWNYFKKITKNRGIVFTDGETWREHRRVALTCLRDLGMGKSIFEEKILEEIEVLKKSIAKEEGQLFNPQKHLPKAITNIICSIVYGVRFDYNDDVLKANVDALDQSVRNQSLIGLVNFVPFLEFLPKVLPVDKQLEKNVKMRDDFAKAQIDLHLENLDDNNPRDFIDYYLLRMREQRKIGSPTTLDELQLQRTIQDLFISGSETLTTTLKWAILFMANFQDQQKAVQDEIDRVLGGRQVSMKDRINLPVTEATIMESQRLGNITLFSVPRCTTTSTTVNGWHIPGGTWVFINRWGLHSSPKYWENPEKFLPKRFLTEDLTQVVNYEHFLPYGIGPRNCLGDSLAKMELFLIFTSLLQVFRFSFGDKHPSLKPRFGLNMSPEPYEIFAVAR